MKKFHQWELEEKKIIPAGQAFQDKMLTYLDRMVKADKNKRDTIDGHAYNIKRMFNTDMSARQIATKYRQQYNVKEEAPATSIGNASVALPPTAKFKATHATDRRYRKDRSPVLLKRFRKYT